MSDLFGNLLLWLSLLLSRWQNWASGGGAGGAALLILYLYERITGRTMPKLWYALIFVMFLILGASFMVWRDEHHKAVDLAIQLEKEKDYSKPKLSGKIERYWITRAGNNNESSIITMTVIIKNNGAPSIVSDFELMVQIGDKTERGQEIVLPDKLIIDEIMLKREDYLPEKCMRGHIDRGGGNYGNIQYFVPNVSQEKLTSNGIIILTFKDVANNSYRTQIDVKASMDKGVLLLDKLQKH
jgi:hypothetical protein